MKWDFNGRDDSIELYEEEVIEGIVGAPKDFEVLRFAHKEYMGTNPIRMETKITYDFHFYTGNPIAVSSTTSTDIVKWPNTYLPMFNSNEVYFNNKPFSKSFFKLDFYDTPNPLTQTNYLTIIIPTQQGSTQSATLAPNTPNVNIKKPNFILDYVGDKEGFFIYWLKSRTNLDIDKFFMSCKFWNAKTGSFSQMINKPQSTNQSNAFNANSLFDFYYQVNLDYDQQTYVVYDTTTFQRVGTNSSPIKWYEYINP